MTELNLTYAEAAKRDKRVEALYKLFKRTRNELGRIKGDRTLPPEAKPGLGAGELEFADDLAGEILGKIESAARKEIETARRQWIAQAELPSVQDAIEMAKYLRGLPQIERERALESQSDLRAGVDRFIRLFADTGDARALSESLENVWRSKEREIAGEALDRLSMAGDLRKSWEHRTREEFRAFFKTDLETARRGALAEPEDRTAAFLKNAQRRRSWRGVAKKK